MTSWFNRWIAQVPFLRLFVRRWILDIFSINISIVKLDPNPSPVGVDVSVVYKLTNLTSKALFVRIDGQTDGPVHRSKNLVLPPGGVIVDSLTTYWLTPGQHLFTVRASVPTGRMLTVYDPSGLRSVAEYSNPITDEATVEVLGPGMPLRPSFSDISPNEAHRTTNGGPCTAGVIGALAGTERILYAVSKTAGVWHSVQGGAWQQLINSPDHVCCLAVDPADRSLIAVGEYGGHSRDPHFDACGVWVSRDAGNAWDFVYDALPDSRDSRIFAVTYSRSSHTLLAGTATGLVRRPNSNSIYPPGFELPPTASGFGPVTAFAVGETKLWARTPTTLLVSSDDGLTWTAIPIPQSITLPSFGNVTAMPNTVGAGGNDNTSLAAFDTKAFVVFKPSDGSGNDPTGNKNTLLIYDAVANAWTGQVLSSGDGRGLAGRRFIKSYVLDCPGLAATVGNGLQLFYGGAQSIEQALGVNPDGTVQWDTAVYTDYSGNPDPRFHIHADIWDFHIGLDYCPPNNTTVWLATDGGVYKAILGQASFGTRPNPDFAGLIGQMQWVTHNDGLHTHNIHAMVVIPRSGNEQSVLAYATADNDGWWLKTDGRWQHERILGDVDSADGDVGNQFRALLTRGFSRNQSVLTEFGDDQSPTKFAINPDGTRLRFIQTLSGELPEYPKLDAVMLTRLPLHDSAGNALPLPAGVGAAALAILRNTHFADRPDGPGSAFGDWTVEEAALPVGNIQDFWVAGGHANPVYYVFATDPINGAALYKRSGPANWSVVLKGLLAGGQFGPAFVSPYDPGRVLAIATDPAHPTGVIMSAINGSFGPDEVLTALVTQSGRFPLGPISPDVQLAAVGSRFHGATMCNPSHVGFDRDNPPRIVVGSPFTGAFVNDPNGGWRTLTPRIDGPVSTLIATPMPMFQRPLGYVSTVGIDSQFVFLGTEGRGLISADSPETAPPASYFDINAALPAVAVLKDATRSPVAFARVYILVTQIVPTTRTLSNGAIVQTEIRSLIMNNTMSRSAEDGSVAPPTQLPPGRHIVTLTFPGDGLLAPCQTSLLVTV